LQPDTLIPGVYSPQSWNRYSYVENRPINFNDPTGHCAGSTPCGDPRDYDDCWIKTENGDYVINLACLVYESEDEHQTTFIDIVNNLLSGITVQEPGISILMSNTSGADEDEDSRTGRGTSRGGRSAKDIIPREKHKEYDELKEKFPDWMPSDDAKFNVRSKEETAAARAEAKGSGHHRHPLKFGGDPNPSEGLVQTGETRNIKNPIHTLITNFWNSVMRLIK